MRTPDADDDARDDEHEWSEDGEIVSVRHVLDRHIGDVGLLPDGVRDEVLLAEDLVHQGSQDVHLVIVDRDEDHAVLPKEGSREEQSRVHHRKPLGAVAPVGLRVGREHEAFLVDLA